MSLADNHPVHSLARSFSNESRCLKASRTQVKVNELNHEKLKETPTGTMPQNYHKINLRNRIVISKNNDFANHTRTISDIVNKNSAYPFDLNIFDRFLKKLEMEKNIDNQVFLLVEFLDEASKTFRVFSEVFSKIQEIIKNYQKHVKSLDSTRIGDLSFEIKNKFQQPVPGKVVKLNLLPDKNVFNDSIFSQNLSGSSQKFLNQIPKNLHFPLKTLKRVTKSDLSSDFPKISSKDGKVPSLPLSTTEKSNFHEEFMQKIDEFSESWREEAMKLKK
jgi:hypothetical protein